jgi:dissimilatory sulfite reductase related protein
MATIELAGQTLDVDERGFMTETGKWNKEIAKAFARLEGIEELTEAHWKVLNYIRQYYLANNMCPMVRRLVKDSGLTLKQIYDLFPEGPAQSACKWAGVPKPTGCA